MKINSEISAPVYLEIVCKKGIETDTLIDEITELAILHKVHECFQLQGIIENVVDNEKSIIVISVDIQVNTPKGEDALGYVKAVFENFFNYYPKYTEPI